MEFNKIIGVEENIAIKAQQKLSGVFASFSVLENNYIFDSDLAGDYVTFATMYLSDHICANNVKSAGTNGKEYFWNPEFVLGTSTLKLRFICQHMAQHSAFLSTEIIKNRNQKLFDISLDFAANGYIMKILKKNVGINGFENVFIKNLGSYIITDELVDVNSSFLLHTECYADPMYEDFSVNDIYDNLVQVLPIENYNYGKLVDEHFYIDESLESISNRVNAIEKFIGFMRENEYNHSDTKNVLSESDYNHLVPLINKLFDGQNIINEFNLLNKIDKFVFCMLSCDKLSVQLDHTNKDDLLESINYIHELFNNIPYENVIYPVRNQITINRLIKYDLDERWYNIFDKIFLIIQK